MPISKKTWIIGIIVVLAIAAGVVWLTLSRRGRQSTSGDAASVAQQAKDLGIKDFSTQGQVEKVEDSKLYLQVAGVQADGAGNKVVSSELIVDLGSNTVFRGPSGSADLTAQDLQAGQNVTVYTSDNPIGAHEISATSVSINN